MPTLSLSPKLRLEASKDGSQGVGTYLLLTRGRNCTNRRNRTASTHKRASGGGVGYRRGVGCGRGRALESGSGGRLSAATGPTIQQLLRAARRLSGMCLISSVLSRGADLFLDFSDKPGKVPTSLSQ
jgi:hypothetical protein